MEAIEVKEKNFTRVDNLMWRVIRLLTKKKRIILDKFDLTCSQFEILGAIYQFSKDKNEIIQINLSEKTQIDPMTTSTVLRNLQKRGLIKRERGLVNTRTVEVDITESGRAIYENAQKEIEQMRKLLYNDIDQQRFSHLLLMLSDKLNK